MTRRTAGSDSRLRRSKSAKTVNSTGQVRLASTGTTRLSAGEIFTCEIVYRSRVHRNRQAIRDRRGGYRLFHQATSLLTTGVMGNFMAERTKAALTMKRPL